MKNVLRGSLLAVLFVGMSSFGSFSNSAESQVVLQDEEIFAECDSSAEAVYYFTLGATGNYLLANDAYVVAYFGCTDGDGDGDQTAVLN